MSVRSQRRRAWSHRFPLLPGDRRGWSEPRLHVRPGARATRPIRFGPLTTNPRNTIKRVPFLSIWHRATSTRPRPP